MLLVGDRRPNRISSRQHLAIVRCALLLLQLPPLPRCCRQTHPSGCCAAVQPFVSRRPRRPSGRAAAVVRFSRILPVFVRVCVCVCRSDTIRYDPTESDNDDHHDDDIDNDPSHWPSHTKAPPELMLVPVKHSRARRIAGAVRGERVHARGCVRACVRVFVDQPPLSSVGPPFSPFSLLTATKPDTASTGCVVRRSPGVQRDASVA